MNLQFKRSQRIAQREASSYLRPHIIEVKRRQGITTCEYCGGDYQELHHIKYNYPVTVNDVKLICTPCHASITDYTRLDYNLKKA